ncbi:MAG: AtpZ/AtpI family protein [Phycisphaerae bacterium]
MSDKQQPSQRAVSATLASMGVEFGAAVCGFCLLGWWIDHHWRIQGHWGVIVCGLLGVVGGLYNFIRQALAASRAAGAKRAAPGESRRGQGPSGRRPEGPEE